MSVVSALKRPDRYKWAVMLIAGSGVFMATLDSSIVNVSLPTIARDLGTDLPIVQWVVLAYLIGIVSTLLTMGRAADMLGRKRVYLTGFVVFGAGSVVCGLSPGIWWLVGARVLQSFGGAMVQSNGAALVVSAFPRSERGRAMGMVGTTVSLGLLSGPMAGGLIAGTLGWPFIFLINVPIVVLATAGGVWLLRESERAQGESFDFAGSVLLALWVFPFIFALNQGRERGWGSPLIVGAMLLAAAFFAAFLISQRAARHPIVDLAVFKVRMFRSSVGTAFVAFTGMSSTALLTPFLLQEYLGLPVTRVGFMMAVVPATSALLALLGGVLADRFGPRTPATAGLVVMAGSVAGLGFVSASTGVPLALAMLVAVGVGQGIFMSPNSSSIMGSLPRSRLGLAGAFLASSRTLGFAMGQAVWGTVFAGVVTAQAEVAIALQAPPEAMLTGFRTGYFAAATVVLAAAALSATRGRMADPDPAGVTPSPTTPGD